MTLNDEAVDGSTFDRQNSLVAHNTGNLIAKATERCRMNSSDGV